jgi:hypothetical protein
MSKFKRLIACLTLVLGLAGAGTVASATPAAALSGFHTTVTQSGSTQTGWAYADFQSGPATYLRVWIRCNGGPILTGPWTTKSVQQNGASTRNCIPGQYVTSIGYDVL